jgi:hypothetical protein
MKIASLKVLRHVTGLTEKYVSGNGTFGGIGVQTRLRQPSKNVVKLNYLGMAVISENVFPDEAQSKRNLQNSLYYFKVAYFDNSSEIRKDKY